MDNDPNEERLMLSALPPEFESSLDRLKNDNSSGAHALTIQACELLSGLIADLPVTMPGNDFLELMARVGRQIVKAHPAIAPLRQMILGLLRTLESAVRQEELRVDAGRFFDRYLEWLREIRFRVAGHAALLIGGKKRILTHSFSTLVVEAIRESRLRGGSFEVIVTESRPVYEGRLLSQHLAGLTIPVTLIVDAAAPGYVERCDLVLLGADRLTESEFINKVGSLSIVMVADRLGIPCYVLTGSDKYLPESVEPVSLSGKSSREVWDEVPPGVTVDNSYFERIPLRLVTGIISEMGITSFGQFSERSGPFFEHQLAFVP